MSSSPENQAAAPAPGGANEHASTSRRSSLQPLTYRGVTLRAVILGAAAAALMAAINPYTAYVLGHWYSGDGALQEGPLEALLVLIFLNTALVRWMRRASFSRREILVTYGMLVISVGLVYSQSPNMVTFLTYAPYQAGGGAGWDNLILPHVPSWLTVS